MAEGAFSPFSPFSPSLPFSSPPLIAPESVGPGPLPALPIPAQPRRPRRRGTPPPGWTPLPNTLIGPHTIRSLRASIGFFPSKSTRCTSSAMGISTFHLRASPTMARVVATPSATMRMPARMSSRRSPRPMRSPTARLRPWRLAQVTMRSPMPARPAKVARFAPRRTPSRPISTEPRVMRAALALSPRPQPSMIPAARATTFFAAPANSTPTTSATR